MAQLLANIIFLFILSILGRVALSWLLVAGLRNEFIFRLDRALAVFTDPLMRPLRRVIPPLGMFDITPMVAIILLSVIRAFILANV